MKKLLLLAAAMFVMNIPAIAYSTTAVLLQHEGNITTYEAEQINDALEAAEDGDAIFLNEGTYPAFNIKKQVSVKGVGLLTVVNGDIKIMIPDNPKLTESLLEYMLITGEVTVDMDITGLRIRQCRVDNGVVFKAKTYDSHIDRCNIRAKMQYGNYIGLQIDKYYEEKITIDGVVKTYYLPYVKGLTVTNSDVWAVNGSHMYKSINANFINCNFDVIAYCGGTLVNCVVRRYGNTDVYNTNFVNTYYCTNCRVHQYGDEILTITFNNCSFNNSYPHLRGEYVSYNVDDYIAKGLIGNDNTVIGVYGGNTPYNLTPAIPKVKDSKMAVDMKSQQLNVSLTVSPK